MQPPDSSPENENAKPPSSTSQSNASKPMPILLEPTPEIQHIYNERRRLWPDFDDLVEPVGKSSRQRRPGLKVLMKGALRRELQYLCSDNRGERIQFKCHDFSKLEEGYRIYVAAQNQKPQGHDSPLHMPSSSSQPTIDFPTFPLVPSDKDEDYIQSGQPDYLGYSDELGSGIASFYSLDVSKDIRNRHQDFLEDYVPFCGDILIEKTAARAWARHSLHMLGHQHLERILDELLRRHGLDVSTSISPDSILAIVEAVRLMKKFRFMISRYFWQAALYDDKTNEENEERYRIILRKRRKYPRFRRRGTYPNMVLQRVKSLFMTPAVYRLATATRRALYFDDLFGMRVIQNQIELSLSSSAAVFVVEFELDWKPLKFFESQFQGRIPRIGSLVTLTGSALYAQATTCEDYLKRTWPDTWAPFLSALQSAIDTKAMPQASSGSPTYFRKRDEIQFKFMPNETLSAVVIGVNKMIVDVAQQISWVSAALSLSPFGQKVAYCIVSLVYVPNETGPQRFKVERVFAQPQPTEESCWLSLFSNATLAWGFPIPPRMGETGIEISIELMAAIAGVRHAIEYDGGVVMKGFSSMLIPIKRDRGANIVQWHLVSSDEDIRLSYQEGIARCPDRALLAEVDLQSLRTTRAILGWCSAVETVLGREDINYENIDYSTAPDFTKPIKIHNVAVGFQQFGTGQMEFTLGPKRWDMSFSAPRAISQDY